ncbi:hypothetical protein [Saccharothrix syringae]|uniref:hypothetical protein n=1 Tax=Saccharothrix syringae TaxID=103733 RepID=UPI0012F9C3DC|nr:hypothetical protein [Saccharothrix syringae]
MVRRKDGMGKRRRRRGRRLDWRGRSNRVVAGFRILGLVGWLIRLIGDEWLR